jgi:transcriptional regulator with XRE-family HTH domain
MAATKGKTVPNRVKELREHRGYTVDELARRASLTGGEILHIQSGSRRGRFETRWAIAQALGAEYTEAFPPMLEAAWLERRQARERLEVVA